MTRRVPVVPTVLVALAIAAMIALGLWQIRRMHWKEAMLARYAAAAHLPPVAFPRVPTDQSLLFRRSTAFCLEPVGWRASAGRNRAGTPGWRHVADCRTGAEGPGLAVDIGWSDQSATPVGWKGGAVSGTIGPDQNGQVLLVADTPAPGLQPSEAPSLDAIPNNHFAYAVQWFLFAGVAGVIYAIAVWRRGKGPPPGPSASQSQSQSQSRSSGEEPGRTPDDR